MNLSKRAQLALAAGVGAVLVAAASGITYAATTAPPTNDYATACSSAKHALRLLNANGSCPKGTAHISLASAPRTIVIRNVSASEVSRNFNVRGMQIDGRCDRGSYSILEFTSAKNTIYDVRGADYLGNGQSTGFFYQFNGGGGTETVGDTSDGAGYISYTAAAGAPDSRIVVNVGELNTDLIVAQSGHTFTVHLYMQDDANSCIVEAQISQSS